MLPYKNSKKVRKKNSKIKWNTDFLSASKNLQMSVTAAIIFIVFVHTTLREARWLTVWAIKNLRKR